MIAAGDNIHASGKYFFGRLWCDAGTACGILAIGDHPMQSVLLAKSGNEFFDGATSRLPDHVTNEKHLHATTLRTHTLPASWFSRRPASFSDCVSGGIHLTCSMRTLRLVLLVA